MEKLKPCPFCGNEDIFFEEGISHSENMYFLFCGGCGVCSGPFFDKQSAIKWWNTRAASWIKTSERLPYMHCDVLFYHDRYWMVIGYLDDGNVIMYHGGEYSTKNILTFPYWMPLPEPPEVEE